MRQIPDDFKQYALCESNKVLAKRYAASTTTIRMWRTATGLHCDPFYYAGTGVERRPIPADFADIQADMTMRELAAHYSASIRSIGRWCKAIGATRERYTGGVPPKPKPRPAGVTWRNKSALPPSCEAPTRDTSPAGQAADYLRRFGAVIRCDEAGRYDPNGAYWRRGGSSPLTADDIMQRAARQGWRVAA